MARRNEETAAESAVDEEPKVTKRNGVFQHDVTYVAGKDQRGNPIVKRAPAGSAVADAEGLSAETFAELKATPGALGVPQDEAE